MSSFTFPDNDVSPPEGGLGSIQKFRRASTNTSDSSNSGTKNKAADSSTKDADKAEQVDDEDGNKADETETQKPLDPALVGMSVGLKHLYSGKEDKKGRFYWQDQIPEDIGKPAEDAETQKWALIVRHVKVFNDPSKVLSVHSIVIQSPLLKDLLKSVLKGYPGITVGLRRLEFGGQFEPLIHRWLQLTAAIEELRQTVQKATKSNDGKIEDKAVETKNVEPDTNTTSVEKLVEAEQSSINTLVDGVKYLQVTKDGSPITQIPREDGEIDTTLAGGNAKEGALSPEEQDATKLKHAELLQKLLVSEFQTLIDSTLDMTSKGVITYDELWTLFQPGAMIYSKVEGQERIFRLRSARAGVDRNRNPVFWLVLLYVDYDGSRFGYQTLNIPVRPFEGTRSITALTAFPLDYHKDKDEMKTKLMTRGAKIESFAGTHYRAYEGVGWRISPVGEKEKYSVKGRIVIDSDGWNRFNPNYAIYVDPLNKADVNMNKTFGGGSKGCGGDYDEEEDEYEGYDAENEMEEGMPIDGHFADDEDDNRPPLSDDQKLLCTHLIRGYALQSKLWLNMYVNSVHDITFNTRAFESLVLPETQKELILGFTSSQRDQRDRYDDVIEGKGRGIILLMFGNPGTGKTLTAEACAEELRVPLFAMSAGDVGVEARNIESRLLDVFAMVTRWNAVLLLDEADVFLEERSLHEVERNKLVSIFLRVLEYYEGIMFLTTNRVQTFDAAFQSRIHISLEYPDLNVDSRKQIWKNFLVRHNTVQQNVRDKGPAKETTHKHHEVEKEVDGPLHPVEDDAAQTAEKTKLAEQELEESTQAHCITTREIDELARMKMNGRQIKNVLKMAQLLAGRKKESMSKKHIMTVLEVTQHLHNSTRETERTKSSIFN